MGYSSWHMRSAGISTADRQRRSVRIKVGSYPLRSSGLGAPLSPMVGATWREIICNALGGKRTANSPRVETANSGARS